MTMSQAEELIERREPDANRNPYRLEALAQPVVGEQADDVERDIRIAIWNAGMNGGMGQDLSQAFIGRAMAEPTMIRAPAALAASPSPEISEPTKRMEKILDASFVRRNAPVVPQLPLMSAAFRTTVSGDGYRMDFKFPSIEALHAADDEWRAFRKDAQCKDGFAQSADGCARATADASITTTDAPVVGDEGRREQKPVPPSHWNGYGKYSMAISFDPGSMTINLGGFGDNDGDGCIAFADEVLEYDEDPETGKQYRWASLPNSELIYLRDKLNEIFPLAGAILSSTPVMSVSGEASELRAIIELAAKFSCGQFNDTRYDLKQRLDRTHEYLTTELAALSTPVTEAAQERDQLRHVLEALTPHSETKAAYMGEFSWTDWRDDENGVSSAHEMTVPWTTIKEIMAAIRERAGVEKLDESDAMAVLEECSHAK